MSRKWLPQTLLKSNLDVAVEVHPSPDAFRATSLLKVTPTLMNIDNMSLQSLGRFNRGVGVTDLRDALEGRSVSNPALPNQRPASISTLDHASSFVAGDATSNHQSYAPSAMPRGNNNKRKKKPAVAPSDVRDALDKLGVRGGTKPNGSTLKSSFPIVRKADTP